MSRTTNIQTLPQWTEPENLAGARAAILSLGRSMHEHAYILGKTLAWVKTHVGHGKFGEWMKNNVWFSERTAQRVISFALACDQADTLLEYSPRKNDTVSDLAVPDLPEPIDADRLTKLARAYEMVDEWDRDPSPELLMAREYETEGERLEAKVAELRKIDLEQIDDPKQLKAVVDAAEEIINKAHEYRIRSLRELGKILIQIPKEQQNNFLALANLPAVVRRQLVAERVAELI